MSWPVAGKENWKQTLITKYEIRQCVWNLDNNYTFGCDCGIEGWVGSSGIEGSEGSSGIKGVCVWVQQDLSPIFSNLTRFS